jgi:plasmid stabilization system protein ParE
VTKVDVHRRATAEMIEAAQFYERQRPGLGLRFIRAIEDASQRVAESPEAGPLLGQRDRRRLVTGFQYSIVYRIEEQRVLVLAVMHQRRKPGYWKWRRYR